MQDSHEGYIPLFEVRPNSHSDNYLLCPGPETAALFSDQAILIRYQLHQDRDHTETKPKSNNIFHLIVLF